MLKNNPSQFPLSSNTGSEPALEFLASNLRVCRASHAQCRIFTPNTGYFPTRVVDVGQVHDTLVQVRKYSDLAQRSEYVTLSHCWGGTQFVTLTVETEAMLYPGIAVKALPHTFQDAIFVCRKLRFHYLWIDSLWVLLLYHSHAFDC